MSGGTGCLAVAPQSPFAVLFARLQDAATRVPLSLARGSVVVG